jgi:NAD(P)-dependent dehydrogenase (short-subunit alcohol dehydrogenase family)
VTSVMIVGGTSGIGQEIGRYFAGEGASVFVTGRDIGRASKSAALIGGGCLSCAFDLSRPREIAAALAEVPPLDHLVLAAIDRDENTVADYDVERALELATLKLVGYVEVVHALGKRITNSIVMFGGLAKERPYPGSTMVSTVNGGITTMVHTLAVELAPVRVNGIHPGIVGDSPYWRGRDLSHVVARTPGGRLPQMADIVDATVFLLRNPAVNGVNLHVDGGWLLS